MIILLSEMLLIILKVKLYVHGMCHEWSGNENLINCFQDEVQADSSYKFQWASANTLGDS